MSIAVAVRAMSAVMRRAAVRGVVPCRISSVVSFLHLVEYRFPSHRTVRSFRRPACRFCVSCRIRLHCMACHTGLERRAAVFSVSLLSRLISSHCLIVSFRLVSSLRLISTRSAIRFARYGRREEDVIRLFICTAVFKQFRMVFQSGVDMVEYPSCLVFPYIVRLNIM